MLLSGSQEEPGTFRAHTMAADSSFVDLYVAGVGMRSVALSGMRCTVGRGSRASNRMRPFNLHECGVGIVLRGDRR